MRLRVIGCFVSDAASKGSSACAHRFTAFSSGTVSVPWTATERAGNTRVQSGTRRTHGNSSLLPAALSMPGSALVASQSRAASLSVAILRTVATHASSSRDCGATLMRTRRASALASGEPMPRHMEPRVALSSSRRCTATDAAGPTLARTEEMAPLLELAASRESADSRSTMKGMRCPSLRVMTEAAVSARVGSARPVRSITGPQVDPRSVAFHAAM